MLEVLVLASLTIPLDPSTAARPTTDASGGRLSTIHWADVDQDGLDDAFVIAPGGAGLLLRNQGDGTFEDVTAVSGLGQLDASTLAAFADRNNDHWPDLFVATSRGARLFENQGGVSFTEVTLASGLALGEQVLHADWLDYDQDGFADLHLRTENCDHLYRNLGAGAFQPVDLHLPEVAGTHATGATGAGFLAADPAALDPSGDLGPDRAGPIQTSPRTPDVTVDSGGADGALRGTSTGGSQYIGGGASHSSGPPPLVCSDALVDQATSACGLQASTTPVLGMLYPLSTALNVDSAGKVGMGTTSPAHRLHVIETAATGIFGQGGTTGVRGEANLAGSGNRYGGYFTSSGGSNNIGVFGTSSIAVYGVGTAYGALGETNTSSSVGVYGKTNHVSAATTGVLGEAASTAGVGVKGNVTAASGTTTGVLGTASSPDGIGVLGTATTTAVKGQASGSFGRGVSGVNTFVPIIGSALPVGVYGEVAYVTGRGVHGVNTSTTGSGDAAGVFGEAFHPNGAAVSGWARSSSGLAQGVLGISSASDGSGVYGQGASFTGTNYGVHGQTNSSDGYAVYAEGRLRVDGNAGVGVPGAPSHRLTVQSADAETVRLIANGAFGSGARFNFGDQDFVFIEEDVDDHMKLHSQHGLKLTCSSGYMGLDVQNNGATGNSTPTILATNDSTLQGIAIKAVSKGTDGTMVLTQQGSGAIIRGFRTGSTPVFEVTNTGRCVTTALQITGGGDLVEGFDAAPECEPGSVVVIDPTHPGDLMLSSEPYDRKVAGVVSGAGGVAHGIQMGQDDVLDGDTLVAMTGRVYVRCTSENGPIVPGDRLTSASTPGLAMRATDPARCDGAVIGKAMSALEEGTGLVLVLVNLQ